MDINDVRIVITVVSLAIFIGIIFWAWSAKQRDSFSEAANLPFIDDDIPPQPPTAAEQNNNATQRGRQ